MHDQQNAHFAHSRDDNCHFCGAPDSVQHQVLECPTTVHLPPVFLEAHEEMIRGVQYKKPSPDMGCLRFQPPCFFTDGNCFGPTDARHRLSGYAIVCPLGPVEVLATIPAADLAVLEQHFAVLAVAHQQ